MTCPHCQYEWVPRVGTPRKCPNQRCQKPLDLDSAPAPVTLARQTGGDVESGAGEAVPAPTTHALEALSLNMRERYLNRHGA